MLEYSITEYGATKKCGGFQNRRSEEERFPANYNALVTRIP
jgi:hypothetical protein